MLSPKASREEGGKGKREGVHSPTCPVHLSSAAQWLSGHLSSRETGCPLCRACTVPGQSVPGSHQNQIQDCPSQASMASSSLQMSSSKTPKRKLTFPHIPH